MVLLVHMSKVLLNLLILTAVFAGSYFWYVAQAICPIPLTYHVGELDEEFGITEAEARTAISEAESMWEDATGMNLFTYDEDGQMPINFIFDERQQYTDAEEEFREILDEAKDRNQAITTQYEKLVSQYDVAKDRYETRVASYESELASYNREVASWNDQGGAPKEVYEELNKQQSELDVKSRQLETERKQLNFLVDEINKLSDQANAYVENYNDNVGRYNDAFSEVTEFTQGDYQGKKINIYQFSTHEELVLVLAHELGHALGIGHVENEESIMFMRMQEQSVDSGLTAEDIADFRLVCGDGSWWHRLTSIKIW